MADHHQQPSPPPPPSAMTPLALDGLANQRSNEALLRVPPDKMRKLEGRFEGRLGQPSSHVRGRANPPSAAFGDLSNGANGSRGASLGGGGGVATIEQLIPSNAGNGSRGGHVSPQRPPDWAATPPTTTAIAAAGAGAHTAATNNTSTYFQQATSAAAATASDTYEKDLEALHAAHRRADAAERHASSMEVELTKLRAENENLRRDRDAHRDAARTNRATAESAKLEVDELKKELDVRKAREARAATLLAAFAHRGAECGRELCKRRVDASVSRLGRPGVIRTGLSMTGGGLREVWEDGEAVRDVAQKLYRLSDEKAELERRRAEIEARRGALRERAAATEQRPADTESMPPPPPPNTADEASLREVAEALRARQSSLAREEVALKEERDRLEREKIALAHEMRRQRDEEASRFLGSGTRSIGGGGGGGLAAIKPLPAPFPAHATWTASHPAMLNGRYLLLSLIGKGGFSEVWHAVDLKENREVACKLHQLSNLWKEERKASYVKHAIREVNIHKRLRHANVVAHLDVFEIDADSFCTILELCKGPDLEHVLRAGPLPERVAKSVVRQVMSALRYVSAPPRRIIHYDLKPANVLFDEAGTAKISDFGLSKEMDGDVAPTANGIVSVPGTSSLSTFAASAMPSRIELTSVGAGTYWYLPPECFPGTGELAAGTAPPQISSKVDVWSAGVLTYQALFGERPFAHGQSQETILREGSIAAEARKGVQFPPKSGHISEHAKEFIRRCLSYHQEDRPDVATAADDPWLRA